VADQLWLMTCIREEEEYRKTYYYSDRNCLFTDLPFLFTRQHKLWNDAQLRTATVTRFSWYFAANTTVF